MLSGGNRLMPRCPCFPMKIYVRGSVLHAMLVPAAQVWEEVSSTARRESHYRVRAVGALSADNHRPRIKRSGMAF